MCVCVCVCVCLRARSLARYESFKSRHPVGITRGDYLSKRLIKPIARICVAVVILLFVNSVFIFDTEERETSKFYLAWGPLKLPLYANHHSPWHGFPRLKRKERKTMVGMGRKIYSGPRPF